MKNEGVRWGMRKQVEREIKSSQRIRLYVFVSLVSSHSLHRWLSRAIVYYCITALRAPDSRVRATRSPCPRGNETCLACCNRDECTCSSHCTGWENYVYENLDDRTPWPSQMASFTLKSTLYLNLLQWLFISWLFIKLNLNCINCI